MFFFSNPNSKTISFIEISNLIKNLLYAIANKTIPKYKNLDFLPDFKKCWFLLYYLPLFYMYMQLL